MGERLKREGRGVVRSRAAVGLILLVLAAHGFVASVTHFHAPYASADGSARTAITSRDAGERTTPLPGDARCFLCRLQRDLVSGLQHSTLALTSPAVIAPEHESLRDTHALAAPASLRSGRAPPLA